MTTDCESTVAGKRRVLVVEDHPLFRDGLIHLINREDDCVIVGYADSVRRASEAIETSQPHLLLLDLRLEGGGDTLDFIKRVRAGHPEVRMLVLSQYDEMDFAERCLRAGADGYVTKSEAGSEVIAAMRAVLKGETYLSRRVAALVLRKAVATRVRKPSGIQSLTDRQLYVFQLLGAGLGNSEIAKEMKVSVNTVETHRDHIKEKLGVKDAASVARLAVEWTRGSVT